MAVATLRPGWLRLVLDLDEAVDVVRFDSFSSVRKRFRAVIGPDGHSKEWTSDAEPHVRLNPGSQYPLPAALKWDGGRPNPAFRHDI